MVDALESGACRCRRSSEPQRAWLRKAEDPAVLARAAKLGCRRRVRGSQAGVRGGPGRAEPHPQRGHGTRVFVSHCANCHRLDREGYAVGPDLYGIRSQPKESILLHIVIPEQEVAPNFAAYDCVTTDGRTISGIMTADTPASVTLRQALGIEETIPRERIKRLTASKFSLMPPGLEQAMSRQELADLLAYLRGREVRLRIALTSRVASAHRPSEQENCMVGKIGIFALLFASLQHRRVAASELRVGAAAEVITPAAGTPMSGYNSTRIVKAVDDDLYAKAIVIERDGVKVALVACDLITMPRPVVEEARRLIAEKPGIPADHVMISATHTHTGPLLSREVPAEPERRRGRARARRT